MTRSALLAVAAAGLLALPACGDDSTPAPTDTATTTDTVTPGDSFNGDTNGTPDTTVAPDTTGSDACNCGTRECGTFNGCNCGTCDPSETCNAAGRCEVPGAPLGSFCGLSATCTADNADECMDDQCESKNCLSMNPAAVLLRDVCSRGCQIYKDSDNNGVNDADAAIEDCNPDDVVDGPAGNAYRCVNFADPQSTPLGLCAPGSEFGECNADSDCPAGEGCELTTIGGDFTFRCVANLKAGTWGAVSGLGESCNDDPTAGDVSACQSGLCFGLGCVTRCNADNDAVCDTTDTATACDTTAGTCKGKPSVSCTTDMDCSGWTCGEPRQILGDGMGGLAGPFWRFCWPKSCATDDNCGANFYCRFFWNGEIGAGAALDNMCLAQDPAGADLGAACDDEAGPTCKNADLCLGGACSALCATNDDCASNQVCAVAELPGDTEPVNADGTEGDGVYDFVLPISWCEVHPRNATECLANANCAANEHCDVYEVENRLADGTLNPDGPYVLTGACVADDANKADWGGGCESGSDCKSGFCLGADAETNTIGFCTKPCSASSECEAVSIGGETANGVCSALLYAWGGNLNDPRGYVYVPLCLLDISTLSDCAAGFDCAEDHEICLPNPISSGANVPGKVEFLCQAAYDPAEPPTTLPTKAVGDACDLEGEDIECAGAVCLEDKDGNGYCSALCDPATDTAENNGTTCQVFTNMPRKGAYLANAPSFHLWQKDQECTTCAGDWSCPGDLVCANLGGNGAAAKYRCVPGCTDVADCAAETVTTACSTSKDPFGAEVKGCFARGASLPVNYCAQ